MSTCRNQSLGWWASKPSIKHSFTSSHSRFISLSARYLHIFAISSHSSGPPPLVGAGPPMSLIRVIAGEEVRGAAKVKLVMVEREEEMSASEVWVESDEPEEGDVRGRKDGRSFLRGMIAVLAGSSTRDGGRVAGGMAGWMMAGMALVGWLVGGWVGGGC